MSKTIIIPIQFGREKFDLECKPEDTVLHLKHLLAVKTGVEEPNQKIICKGARLKDDKVKVVDTGLSSTSKIILVGTKTKQVERIQSLKEDKLLAPFERKRPKTSIKLYKTKPKPCRFSKLEVLDRMKHEQAKAILNRLSYDIGVVGVMEKRNWKVGILKEMPPEGPKYSKLLGLNVNHGQKILLRLRHMDGFLPYSSIKATLFHELTHIEIGPHNDEFHRLNRKLQAEAAEFDWKSQANKKGKTTGGYSIYRPEEEEEEEEEGDDKELEGIALVMAETAKESGHALGGKSGTDGEYRHIRPGLLAYSAAVLRLTEEEKRLTEACGSSFDPNDDDDDDDDDDPMIEDNKSMIEDNNALEKQHMYSTYLSEKVSQCDDENHDLQSPSSTIKCEHIKEKNNVVPLDKEEIKDKKTLLKQEFKADKDSLIPDGFWECSVCTFLNKGLECLMCLEPCPDTKHTSTTVENSFTIKNQTTKMSQNYKEKTDNTKLGGKVESNPMDDDKSKSSFLPNVDTIMEDRQHKLLLLRTKAAEREKSWNCSACTYLNESKDMICSICSSKRQS